MCCVQFGNYTTLANRQPQKLDLLTATTMLSSRIQMVKYQAKQIIIICDKKLCVCMDFILRVV